MLSNLVRLFLLCLASAEPPDLGKLVVEYFQAPDASRKQLAKSIETAARGDVRAVAAAVREANLWEPLSGKSCILPTVQEFREAGGEPKPTVGKWTIDVAPGRSIEVAFKMPPTYDSAIASPLIVGIPAKNETLVDSLLSCRFGYPNEAERAIIVAVDRRVAGEVFGRDPETAGDFSRILRGLHRRVHTDLNRTYLYGLGLGGDAAWLVALTHPDRFAQVAVYAAHPPLPHADQLLPLLHENVRDVPFLVCWKYKDQVGDDLKDKSGNATPGSLRTHLVFGEVERYATVNAFNHLFCKWAVNAGTLVNCDPVEPWNGGLPLLPVTETPPRPIPGFFPKRVTLQAENPSIWFRYPAHGRVGWLRQTRWAGPIWTEDQISIHPAPSVDRDEYITSVLKDKLAFLGGTKDGQTIHIETRKCAEIELRIPESWDFSRPFTVFINGRKRFEGLIEPSIKTLLDCAVEDWDTQNLIVATRRFSIRENE